MSATDTPKRSMRVSSLRCRRGKVAFAARPSCRNFTNSPMKATQVASAEARRPIRAQRRVPLR